MIIHQAKATDREIADFTGSTSWHSRFLKRNQLCMWTKTKISQKMPDKYEENFIEFHRFVINAQNEKILNLHK